MQISSEHNDSSLGMLAPKISPDALDPPRTVADASAGIAGEGAPIWEEAEGQIVNAGWIGLAIATFWLVFPLLLVGWKMWRTSRHRYRLTDQRLHETCGVLFRDVEELELYRVKDISAHEPPLQAMFGRGRVVLITSDRTTPTVVLNAISAPLQVANLIRDRVERCRVFKGVREVD